MIDKYYQPVDEEVRTIHNINNSNIMEHQHYHDSYEIHFTVSHKLKFIINDELFWAPKGSVFIIDPLIPHMSVVADGVWFERYTVHIKSNIIKELNTFSGYNLFDLFNTKESDKVNHIKLNQEGILIFENLLNRLINYSREDYFGADVFQKLSLTEVLFYLLRIKKEGVNHEANNANDENYNLVRKIMNYIIDNLESDLNLDVISDKFFRSKSTVNRIFKQYSGTTVTQYITSRRIYRSCELLKENIPVFTACERSGFSDYNHFIRTFKKYIGITPKQYTLQHLDTKSPIDIYSKPINTGINKT